MKVYKLFWTRLLGLAAFLGTFLFVCLIPVQQQANYVQYVESVEDQSSVKATPYVMQAVSFLFRNIVGITDASETTTTTIRRHIRSTYDDIVADEVEEDDEQYNYDDNNNRVFQKGDFDYHTTTGNGTTSAVTETVMIPFKVAIKVGKRAKSSRNVTVSVNGMPIIEDTIFWSTELEKKMPPGLTDDQVSKFLYKMKNIAVERVEPPSWNRCGRPKNQFVTFEDGTHVCARYRTPHDYLVQGEVLSFYLSRLLAINHVPPVTLSAVDKGDQWKAPNVTASLKIAEWLDNATVALIMWVDGLERDRMPPLLLKALLQKTTISWNTPELTNLTSNQMLELLQWSNLIVFDYITGNYDRVASMQDAADKEKKVSILHETIHNLVTSRRTGSLWLIDNESGLLDSYALLYGTSAGSGTPPERRFIAFHRDMLRTMCLFRKPLVDRIRWLYHRGHHTARVLVDFVERYEPLYRRLPNIFEKNKAFVQHFHRRIAEVYRHVKTCQVR